MKARAKRGNPLPACFAAPPSPVDEKHIDRGGNESLLPLSMICKRSDIDGALTLKGASQSGLRTELEEGTNTPHPHPSPDDRYAPMTLAIDAVIGRGACVLTLIFTVWGVRHSVG